MEQRTVSQRSRPAPDAVSALPARLYYLDWLRVIATFGVFLMHVTEVFSEVNFEIKNAEQSALLTILQGMAWPWGMPLFFFVAGAGSYFALRRRSAGQFTRERTFRLLVPFLTGTLLLGPIQLYLSWRHRVATGVIDWTFAGFVAERFERIGPKLFGAAGYHMWFLGFLFAYSLLALPLLLWFKGEAGRRAIGRLAGFCEQRAGVLLFILPLIVLRLVLQPFFPIEHDWADFLYYGAYFVLGYVVFADPRFTQAIRRDGWILLAVGLAATAAFGLIVMAAESLDLERGPATFTEWLFWALVATAGWCGTAFMVYVGMRWLDRSNRALQYSLGVMLPFFVLHQPVIIALAYFVVQWPVGLFPKLLVVLLGAFALTLALCELVIKRVGFLRLLFGMKGEPEGRPRTAWAA